MGSTNPAQIWPEFGRSLICENGQVPVLPEPKFGTVLQLTKNLGLKCINIWLNSYFSWITSQIAFQAKKTLTDPLTALLQIVQFAIKALQSEQQIKWPQGRNTTHTFFSRQILQSFKNFIFLLFSSFNSREARKTTKQLNPEN